MRAKGVLELVGMGLQTRVVQNAIQRVMATQAVMSLGQSAQVVKAYPQRKKLNDLLVRYAELHEGRADNVRFRDSQIAEGLADDDVAFLDGDIDDIDDALKSMRREINTFIGKDGAAKFLADAKLISVTKDSDERILAQLHANEAVHPVYSFADFKAQRIGNEGDDKSTHALEIDVKGAPIVLAAVFVKHANLPVNGHDSIDISHIPSNLMEIKTQEPAPLRHDGGGVCAKMLYTITNPDLAKGAARALAERFLKSTTQTALISTLSPMRQLYEKIPVDQLIQMDDEAITRAALKHLGSGDDSVLHFHVKTNGAQGVKLTIDRSDPKDPVRMNYLYSADHGSRARSADMSKRGALPIADHLVRAARAENIQFGVAQRGSIRLDRDCNWANPRRHVRGERALRA